MLIDWPMALRKDQQSWRDYEGGAPRADSDITDRGDVTGALSGRVVVSVGRGGPVQAAVNRALKAAGAIVLVKPSMAEIVKMLAAFVPSVIITEVVPGDEGGPAILSAVRGLPPERGGNVPIVGVSWETLDPAPMMRAGFQGALVGPFDALDVARTVLKAIRQAS